VKGASGIRHGQPMVRQDRVRLTVSSNQSGLRITFSGLPEKKRVEIFNLDGKRVWDSGTLPASADQVMFTATSWLSLKNKSSLFVRLTWGESHKMQTSLWMNP
ncbi:MAG TPA: hypothetical protein VJ385_22780, partial [Fibrobacteria bacterium]|nr:hypothetical protein [Fibrobacteria bacterium]